MNHKKGKIVDGEIGRETAQYSAKVGNQVVRGTPKPTLKSNNPTLHRIHDTIDSIIVLATGMMLYLLARIISRRRMP